VLDVPQPSARRLVAAVRPLRRRVEPLQLHEHALGLCALGADLVGMRSRRCRPDQADHKQANQQCRDGRLPPRHAK